jgi:hypothetical protein
MGIKAVRTVVCYYVGARVQRSEWLSISTHVSASTVCRWWDSPVQ